MPAQPRGIRNNNPMNIDRNSTKWQGMAADQSSDPRFVVFVSPEYGIRAGAKTLLTYHNTHGLSTIRQVINRWAPPKENNTAAYVAAVAAEVGVDPGQKVDIDSVEIMRPLVKAIIRHENGRQPYTDAVITEGLRMAGVVDAKPKPLIKSRPIQAQALGLAAVGASAVAEYAKPAQDAATALAPASGAPIIGKIQTLLLTVAGLAILAGIVAAWLKRRATGE